MSDSSDQQRRCHVVGGGIAGLAAAVFLLRDAGVPGECIHIHEGRGVPGGSLDGSGDADAGYLTRGGRMFERHFACTFDLLSTIPTLEDPEQSVTDQIMAFNRRVPGSSNCRLVRNGEPAEDRDRLTLSAHAIVDLNRLILSGESGLDGRRIDDWFQSDFFESNFWIMWSTMFSFQPWHSLTEMRRYLKRFIHLFPGFTRIAGVLRTPLNQYDSLIEPIRVWLLGQGVQVHVDSPIVDLDIAAAGDGRMVRALRCQDGTEIGVREDDRVFVTLGSMTDASRVGGNTSMVPGRDAAGPAWALWRTLAARESGFGRPEVFCGDTASTAWHSFTVTLDGPDFFEFMEDFTNNRTGTGGLLTIADSSWFLSIVLFHQPHFRDQKHGTYVFWGYGLRGDRPGDFIGKPMWEATGNEIIQELCDHLRLSPAQRQWFDSARVVTCRMPFITSQFMPRQPGDRPDVCPDGARNFAFLGQFVEQPRDCVFTVEYSVRSASAAVAALTGTPQPPGVARTDLDPRVLARAGRVLLGL